MILIIILLQDKQLDCFEQLFTIVVRILILAIQFIKDIQMMKH